MPLAGTKWRDGLRACGLVMVMACILISDLAIADVPLPLSMPVRVVDYFSERDVRPAFDKAVLKLALEHAASQAGPAQLVGVDGRDGTLGQRFLFQETSGWSRIDVALTMATDARSKLALPVEIDVSDGLIGKRVLIVRKADQALFANVKNIAHLKTFTICVGADWPDAGIMEAAGLQLARVNDYEDLFKALAHKKCDGITRAVYEAFDEIKSWPTYDFVVEPTLLIQYPARNIFYVAPNRSDLVQRIKAGLMLAAERGKLKQITQLYYADARRELMAGNRRVLELPNPLDSKSAEANVHLPGDAKMKVGAPPPIFDIDDADRTIKKAEKVEVIRFFSGETARDRRLLYTTNVIVAAVDKSIADFGPAELRDIHDTGVQYLQKRALDELGASRDLDVVVTMETKERNARYRKVDRVIDRGLLGARVLLVRRAALNAFSNIRELADLRKFSVGLGHDWPDVEIMRANGFRVVTSTEYVGLFKMLTQGRFDFMSRGLLEFVPEMKLHSAENLDWVPKLILSYPAPLRFYVARDNPRLAARLERGLTLCELDGTLNQIFWKHYAESLAHVQAHPNPVILPLKNPLVDASTPMPNLDFIQHINRSQ